MEVTKLEDASDWPDEPPKVAAAAVASVMLPEADVTLAVGAEAVEVVSRPRREVFPLPTPTAGTFPVSLPVPEDEVALAVDDIDGQEVSVSLLAVAVAVVVAAAALSVTGAEVLKRDKRDVLPPPTPTAGTLPCSVPAPVAAARLGRPKVIGSRPEPTT